ncbi:hypothetical protein Taro_054737 [Colocasia esculenta]|uniref:Uncharacterized protein n=1 Tax=Colocasia esculenta TaxID=4460 RepID=A0A843XRD5_COLES|nr:hypothetical protein [Colocasia esculenta]
MKRCVPLCLHGLWCGIPCEASARSRETDSDQKFEMADRRDWGGGGDDPEENTQLVVRSRQTVSTFTAFITCLAVL